MTTRTLLVLALITTGCGDHPITEEPDLAPAVSDDAGAACACDDGNPCTLDECRSGECRHVPRPNATDCGDDDACNGESHCQDGTCVHLPAPDCDDGVACTDDTCLPASGCVHTPRDVACADTDPCTTDTCDVALGCQHGTNTAVCDDGMACTTSDQCTGGACVGGAPSSGCTPCQAAAILPAAGGVFFGATSGASTIAPSCDSGNAAPERVYEWTPSQSGTALIETCGSLYDTVLSIRKGTCTNGFDSCNDDMTGCKPGHDQGSRLLMPVIAGQRYYLVVDGNQGASGNYKLTVVPPNTCGNHVREGSEACDGRDRVMCPSRRCDVNCQCLPPMPGTPDLIAEISDVLLELGTSVPTGDVTEGCAGAMSGVDLLRFTMTTRNVGTADLQLGNPQCPDCSNNPLVICTNPLFHCSPAGGHDHGHYLNYASYELFNAMNQLVGTGHKQGFCLWDSACGQPLYTCVDQGLTAGCGDTYANDLGCQYIDVTGVPAGDYLLRVTVDPLGQIAELSETNNVTEHMVTITRP